MQHLLGSPCPTPGIILHDIPGQQLLPAQESCHSQSKPHPWHSSIGVTCYMVSSKGQVRLVAKAGSGLWQFVAMALGLSRPSARYAISFVDNLGVWSHLFVSHLLSGDNATCLRGELDACAKGAVPPSNKSKTQYDVSMITALLCS